VTGERRLDQLRGHVVILNVNEKTGRVVEELAAGSNGAPLEVVLLVQDAKLWRDHPDWHPRPDLPCRLHVVEGCPAEPDDLGAVGVDRARAALILADPRQGALADAHSTLVAVAIERRRPQVHTVMELVAPSNRVHLEATEVDEVVCQAELDERLLAQCCVSPGIGHVFASLLSANPDTCQAFIVAVPPELAGATYRQLARRALEAGAPFVLAGFLRAGPAPADPRRPPPHTLVLNPRPGADPGKDTPLGERDRLVAIARVRPDLAAALGGHR
jgi:hypothetical protein